MAEKLTKDERRELERIRGRVRRDGYSGDVDGVHTFDTAQMFDDMRTLLRTIKRLGKQP